MTAEPIEEEILPQARKINIAGEDEDLGKKDENMESAEDLPRANVRRIVKAKLAGGLGHKDVQVNKDALSAFSEGAKIFIHYLSATANEICQENKRQTINASDVLKAIQEIDFPEFIPQMEETLELFRKESKSKKQEQGKPGKANKKRKAAEDLVEDHNEEISNHSPVLDKVEEGISEEPNKD